LFAVPPGPSATQVPRYAWEQSMRRLVRLLYFWVLVGVVVGVLLGALAPAIAVKFQPLGDWFIKLVKMMVAPIIFCTVVLGIAHMGSARSIGRIATKAIVYFELLTTVALGIGLAVVNILRPGAGIHADPRALDPEAVTRLVSATRPQTLSEFVLSIIPSSLPAGLVTGEPLQVLLGALLVGFALTGLGERGDLLVRLLESVSAMLFKVVSLILCLAPLGAFGAMAFTVGRFGLGGLRPLAALMGSFYLTCVLFIFVGLALVCRLAGFSLLRLLAYLRDELVTVLGTSSSESVLAPLMEKLERLGCRSATVGLVVPTGYSFNLDGTCIYLTVAAVFLAQALDMHLSIGQQLAILVVAMLTSKGSAGVTGAGFITLAATLAVVPGVPVAAMTLILGVDRFMSEARSLTNLIGNAVATVVISRWEREISAAGVQAALRRRSDLGSSAERSAAVAPSVVGEP
jgi:aerobic C4-dicarboxylate transport protein